MPRPRSDRPWLRLLRPFVILMLVLGTWSPAASAALPSVRAVQIPSQWQGLSDAVVTRTMTEAAATGANTVRLPVFWSSLFPSSATTTNPTYVARLDALAKKARASGIQLLPALMATPCWAADPCGAAPPRRAADYGAAVSWLLTRYPKDIRALEIWNEPNLPSFWTGTPAQYVELVQAAATARRTLRSAVPIVGGALAGSDVSYLTRLYAAGLGPASDAVSIHPYDLSWATSAGQFLDPTLPRAWDATGSFAYGVPAARAAMLAAGDGASLLWITEFGYATCPATPTCVSEQQAATWTDGALKLASGWGYLGAFTLFTLSDDATAPAVADFDRHFGLERHDFTRKPAWAVAAKWFRGR